MLEVIKAQSKDKEVLFNLLEKYLYEFSKWEKTDINEQGLYDYEWLDYYFSNENRFPYLIKVDNKLAGFILVSDYPEVPEEETDFCLSEFFIMHKYRRMGYGKRAIFNVLDRHHGKWQLKCHPKNTISVLFWTKVISEYTNGKYRMVEGYPNEEVDYDDGTPANVYFFENYLE